LLSAHGSIDWQDDNKRRLKTMKKLLVLWCVVFVASVWTAKAIDREARMIDRVNLDMATLNDADSYGGSIIGETALATRWHEWAILAGGGAGTIAPLNEDDISYWNVLLGLKLYATPLTGVSAYGKYEQFATSPHHRDAKSLNIQVKQRLLPVEFSVCPFAAGGLTLRERSTFTGLDTQDSFSEFLVNAGGGCEFVMNEELSFEFAVYYQVADASEDETEDLDGWMATVGMLYYWM
jgi:hypothetical protein